MDPVEYYYERFNHEIDLVRHLEQTYAKEKAEASLAPLLDGHTPASLSLAWERTYRAGKLRSDLDEARENAQTYALAVLVERAA